MSYRPIRGPLPGPVHGPRPGRSLAPRHHHPAMLLLAALLLATCLCFAGAPAEAGPINLNAADAATLASELKGVGKVKAQAIIEFRQKHGPFRSVDELAQVKGFSQKLIDRNRADIKLGPVPAGTQGLPPGKAAGPGKGATVGKGATSASPSATVARAPKQGAAGAAR